MSSPRRQGGAIAEGMAAAGGSRLTFLGVKVASNTNRVRTCTAGLLATLLLTVSASALHADTSNAELAKEIAELKAQIRAMKGAISQNRVETRKAVRVARTPAPAFALPPPSGPAFPYGAIPAGATPAFVTADKKLQFGALTITPGGFFEAADVYRSRATNGEIATYPQNIPFGPGAGISENRISARGSRAALLVEGAITPHFLASGYAEIDFLNQGVGSNYNQTSSFVPRIRNLYATLDNSDYGMHVLAGQNWSLVTLNSKGITPRNEVLPPVLDYNLLTGFAYKRQAQIRLVKDFDKKLWLAVSIENPGDTYQGCAAGGVNTTTSAVTGITALSGVQGVTCGGVGTNTLSGVANNAGTGVTTSNVLSLNKIPDIVGKAAYEARVGDRDIHIEGYGIFRDFYDRVAYGNGTSASYNVPGYGGGFGVVVPVIPRRLDFQGSGLIGRGIGSYGPAQFNDATFAYNGALTPISEQMFNAGFIGHVTPSFDVYAYGGVETQQPKYFANGAAAGTLVGSGVPTANNSNCYSDAFAASCAGSTKRIWEITGGFTDKLYKGSFGEIRVGLQYAFFKRELFQGSGATAAAAGVPAAPALTYAPSQTDHVVLTSLRYYPFQ